MGSPIITVESLGKRYLLTHQRREPYTALRDVMAEKAKRLGRRVVRPFSSDRSTQKDPLLEEFWALKDVTFSVNRGERVGIIGRNGAGKSTLLKILSRITEPTEGRIRLRGRVASLLEVGTGFHPELTGRENIFLNGAVLGMTNAEIRKKFDEIVDFAEVEKFLDTPVKRYSSGMYVRLAFAVAAHLEPEILVVDEVLAVGDTAFQRKCLGKMEDVGKGGRTVLFVSHNMQAIRQLCERAILLRSGSLVMDDSSYMATENYISDISNRELGGNIRSMMETLPPDPAFKLDNVILTQSGQEVSDIIENGKPLDVEIHYRVLQKSFGLRVFFDLYDDHEMLLFRSFHDEDNDCPPTMAPGSYVSRAVIPANLLAPIRYDLRIKATIHNVRYTIPEQGICFPLKVEHTSSYNRAYVGAPFHGRFAMVIQWETKEKPVYPKGER
jgi:homopolymeric O-antigen transport system ATP-binding protein